MTLRCLLLITLQTPLTSQYCLIMNTSKTARLIYYVKKLTMLTLRDTNTTETDKVGLQPWTAVSPFLGLVSTV